MSGNLMLAFFIAMPAVVMFVTRHSMRKPLGRAIMTYGGAVAVVLALIVVIPLLACDGSMLSGYTSCAGGPGLTGLIAQSQPVIIIAAKLYILAGIPLALLAFALDRTGASHQ